MWKNHSLILGVRNQRKRKVPNTSNSKLATHDLAALATSSGLSLTDEEVSLLRTLSDIITWEGRYPTPLLLATYHPLITSGTPVSRFFLGNSIFSVELPIPAEIDAMIKKLLHALKEMPDAQSY